MHDPKATYLEFSDVDWKRRQSELAVFERELKEVASREGWNVESSARHPLKRIARVRGKKVETLSAFLDESNEAKPYEVGVAVAEPRASMIRYWLERVIAGSKEAHRPDSVYRRLFTCSAAEIQDVEVVRRMVANALAELAALGRLD